MSLETTLAQGLQALGIECPLEVRRRLLDYVRLLAKWNRVYNLTAVREPLEMVQRHLLDSLTVLPCLRELRSKRVLDVGTGGGLPGIPLALLSPQTDFVLLDSNSKKTRFVQQAVVELGLQNVEVVHARVEEFHPEQPFDAVISRAFSSLREMVEKAGAYGGSEGILLAMKGVYPQQELAELPAGFVLHKSQRLRVPGLDEERHLIFLAPMGGARAN
ncbi:MAG: 16S rRNA (guanine(527)-N(7))-methyltransferase RsmG [Gammaproteobacteria bacterium]|nr:16S rRNA (guanine(527)-N(7))-methyltransferase RsmG [Gammaproteobacteria bacterium]MCF6364367.1 16S rRNA (guanine(527)-N(7))-methyltransferase RsmG [Gammaproteobacteria bacterium]